ncbi:MAG: phosphotransferase [Aeromicrobium sp.]|uniref:phosphotransferase n=1 Tax=Aeromicrobium sp. TaxID=1871063 RepID=UPI0039E2CDAE
MARAFSDEVVSSTWRAQVEEWLATQLSGHTILDVRQTRVRPWSTQLTVDTDQGRLWFKALPPGAAHEAALHTLAAELAPDHVDAPVAVDPARGWILTADHGPSWRDDGAISTQDWQWLMIEVVGFQQHLTPHREALLATGLPDCRPTKTAELYDRFVTTFAELEPGHPCHLDAAAAAALRDHRPIIADAADRLADSALPVTVNHGDLHPGNVHDSSRGARLFDFGDAQWAHACETLAVPRGVICSRADGPVEWKPVLAAYAAAWELRVADVADDVAAAWTTQAVHRCLTWWRALSSASPGEWRAWGHQPVHHLRRAVGDA